MRVAARRKDIAPLVLFVGRDKNGSVTSAWLG
jgi:hypothetical protein